MFGTEKVICPKNSEGWLVRVWDGLNLDRSKLSWELFGLIQTFFYLYPNSIQTGGVVQFCQHMLNDLTLTTGKVTSKACLKHPREVDMRSLGKLDVESNLLVFPSPKAGFILSSLIIDIGARSFWSRIYDLTMIVPFGCSLFSHLFPTQSVSSVLI